MESKEAIALGIYLASGPLVFMPVFMYMGDKINRFGERRHSAYFYVIWWFVIPFMYIPVMRRHRADCSAAPLWILGAVVAAALGAKVIREMMAH
jgi:hypothetical protein